jgi:hypothetical protein
MPPSRPPGATPIPTSRHATVNASATHRTDNRNASADSRQRSCQPRGIGDTRAAGLGIGHSP